MGDRDVIADVLEEFPVSHPGVRVRRTLTVIASSALAGALLTGCGAVDEAVSQDQQALDSANQAVGADQTEFGVARETLQTACALVSMGG